MILSKITLLNQIKANQGLLHRVTRLKLDKKNILLLYLITISRILRCKMKVILQKIQFFFYFEFKLILLSIFII
jgi:hypothetical protein